MIYSANPGCVYLNILRFFVEMIAEFIVSN